MSIKKKAISFAINPWRISWRSFFLKKNNHTFCAHLIIETRYFVCFRSHILMHVWDGSNEFAVLSLWLLLTRFWQAWDGTGLGVSHPPPSSSPSSFVFFCSFPLFFREKEPTTTKIHILPYSTRKIKHQWRKLNKTRRKEKRERVGDESEDRHLRVVIYCIPGQGADGTSFFSTRCGLGMITRVPVHVA